MRILLIIATFLLTSGDVAYGWSSRASKTQYEIIFLNHAIESFREESGRLPTQQEFQSDAISSNVRARDGQGSPLDSWKRPIRYRSPGLHGDYDVYSVGEDGIDDDGKRDDISGWADVNEGYYWKSQWPGGRSMIRWCKIIGMGSLLLGFFLPLKLVVPFAWAIIALGYVAGSQMLLHPGIVPTHNDPLQNRASIAMLALLVLLAVFTFNFRKYILQKRRPHLGPASPSYSSS